MPVRFLVFLILWFSSLFEAFGRCRRPFVFARPGELGLCGLPRFSHMPQKGTPGNLPNPESGDRPKEHRALGILPPNGDLALACFRTCFARVGAAGSHAMRRWRGMRTGILGDWKKPMHGHLAKPIAAAMLKIPVLFGPLLSKKKARQIAPCTIYIVGLL